MNRRVVVALVLTAALPACSSHARTPAADAVVGRLRSAEALPFTATYEVTTKRPSVGTSETGTVRFAREAGGRVVLRGDSFTLISDPAIGSLTCTSALGASQSCTSSALAPIALGLMGLVFEPSTVPDAVDAARWTAGARTSVRHQRVAGMPADCVTVDPGGTWCAAADGVVLRSVEPERTVTLKDVHRGAPDVELFRPPATPHHIDDVGP